MNELRDKLAKELCEEYWAEDPIIISDCYNSGWDQCKRSDPDMLALVNSVQQMCERYWESKEKGNDSVLHAGMTTGVYVVLSGALAKFKESIK